MGGGVKDMAGAALTGAASAGAAAVGVDMMMGVGRMEEKPFLDFMDPFLRSKIKPMKQYNIL